jgi:hypothetical protein
MNYLSGVNYLSGSVSRNVSCSWDADELRRGVSECASKELWKCAEICRVANLMRHYLESIT